jgi:hypothetical protein
MKIRTWLCVPLLALLTTAALGAPEHYEFQLVETSIPQGDDAVVTIRLVDRRTGTPVDGAVIFATRMDMAPDQMEAMTSPVTAMPSVGVGLYSFQTNLTMAGGWRFSVAAKIQGETGTLESRLIFEAVK